MAIKNIIFDVGNVLVRYDPSFIIAKSFPNHPDHESLIEGIFKHQTWLDLNLGLITESQALEEYHARLKIELELLQQMALHTKESLVPMPGSFELLHQLSKNYDMYALTDNTHDIMAYLQDRYDFWPIFKGIVVSATVGHLKPSKEIFEHLLATYQLNPEESLFLDDIPRNIEGAKLIGMQGIIFKSAEQAIVELKKLGIKF